MVNSDESTLDEEVRNILSVATRALAASSSNTEQRLGEVSDDKQNGQREESFSNGAHYKGGVMDGKFHGYGVYTFANGDVYEGEWKDNKCHGEG